jgi:peptide/nickel transport system permease protein
VAAAAHRAKAGAILLGAFILAAVIGPLLTPYDPSFQNASPSLSLHPPDAAHLLGTTQSGQDVFSQLLAGIRLTLELALSVGVVATALSVIVGVAAGFLGGVWDEVLSLATNVFPVIPALPLLIILLGYLPQKGQAATVLVLSGLGWPWGARVIRAQTLAIRGRDFVAASRETGEPTWRILAFEIVPNEISLIAASFVNTVLYAIGASVALAFIGLADLTSWSLGTMLYWAQSQQALPIGAWWWFVPPGLTVALMGTALVLLNSGIDELERAGRHGHLLPERDALRPAEPGGLDGESRHRRLPLLPGHAARGGLLRLRDGQLQLLQPGRADLRDQRLRGGRPAGAATARPADDLPQHRRIRRDRSRGERRRRIDDDREPGHPGRRGQLPVTTGRA